MTRFITALLLLSVGASVSEGQLSRKLTAPTFYIAAKAEYEGPNEIRVVGASNLPAEAQLSIWVSDFVGQGSKILNKQATAVVGQDGFFSVALAPAIGKQFRHNLVCDIVFMPDDPHEKQSVLKIIGRHGEQLGFPDNPQAYVGSGERYYLEDSVHIP